MLAATTWVGLGSTAASASVLRTSGATTASTCAPASTPGAVPDTTLDSLFAAQLGQSGPSWLGGDMAYSTRLPDKQEAFDFNDTVMGTATKEGSDAVVNKPYEGLIHSSELVGAVPLTKSTALSTDQAGTPTAPATLIPDTNTTGGFSYEWELGATLVVPATATVPAEQIIFVTEYQILSPGDLSYDGTSAMALFSLPAGGLPTFQSTMVDSSVPTTMWGNAMTQSGPYTYIYGTELAHASGGAWMDVARVRTDDVALPADWRYFSGLSTAGAPLWVSQEADAVPTPNSNLFTGATHQLGGTGYEAVLLAGSETAPIIDVAYACTPWGPWSSVATVYTPPEIATYAPDEIAYTPTFHAELNTSGNLVISYSINNTAGIASLWANIHEYQPRFLLLPS
jgi:hypothetical protein